jgi:hypothetical protein
LLSFSICAVVDFVFGLVKWHSVVTGIVAIVCGLPLTGLLFLGFRASWRGNDDSGAPGTQRQGATMVGGFVQIAIALIDEPAGYFERYRCLQLSKAPARKARIASLH